MKKILIGSLIIAMFTLVGCDSGIGSNVSVKKFGGTKSLELPKGKKLINITWKDSDLWYLTRDMKDDDIAETYTFQEESNYGLIEGTVIIIESK